MGMVVTLCHNGDIPRNIPSSHVLRTSSVCPFHHLHLCILDRECEGSVGDNCGREKRRCGSRNGTIWPAANAVFKF